MRKFGWAILAAAIVAWIIPFIVQGKWGDVGAIIAFVSAGTWIISGIRWMWLKEEKLFAQVAIPRAVSIGALIVMIVAIVAIAPGTKSDSSASGTTAEAAANVEPTASPDSSPTESAAQAHDRRVPMAKYWDKSVTRYVMAKLLLRRAAAALGDSQIVAASQYVEAAKKFAYQGANESAEDVPDGWDEVHSTLSDAFASLGYAASKLSDAFESDGHQVAHLREAADNSDFEKAKFDLALAQARTLFIEAGGRGEDISDGTSEFANINATIDALRL